MLLKSDVKKHVAMSPPFPEDLELVVVCEIPQKDFPS